MSKKCIFHFGTDVYMSTQNFNPNIVRSDKGRSRNLFLDYEKKLSNVTLVFVDVRHFSAHKGSKIQKSV